MQLLSGTSDPPVSPDACALEILDALPSVMRIVRKEMRPHRNKGLSIPQFRTLAFLVSEKTVNLSAVSEFLSTTLPTASRIVSGLVEKGLVVRHECSHDRRHVDLAATPRGAAMMSAARAAARENLARQLADLPAGDIQSIAAAMSILHTLFAPSRTRCGPPGSAGPASLPSASTKPE